MKKMIGINADMALPIQTVTHVEIINAVKKMKL